MNGMKVYASYLFSRYKKIPDNNKDVITVTDIIPNVIFDSEFAVEASS